MVEELLGKYFHENVSCIINFNKNQCDNYFNTIQTYS